MWLLKKVGGLGGNLNARREFPRFREYFCPGTVSDRAICGDLLWDVVVIYEAKAQEIIELSKYVRPIYSQ